MKISVKCYHTTKTFCTYESMQVPRLEDVVVKDHGLFKVKEVAWNVTCHHDFCACDEVSLYVVTVPT